MRGLFRQMTTGKLRYTLFGIGLATAYALSSLAAQTPSGAAKKTAPAASNTGQADINSQALQTLRRRAEETKSDRVLIWHDGKMIADWSFAGAKSNPIEAMSATKSIVSLAIGRLIDTGQIKSLDEPVSDFYPEWRTGRKAKITLRHLLNHTSGLQADAITTEIYASKDFVKLALAANAQDEPGTKFFYNNKAVNLLAGIVQKASGQRMDKYIGAEIFAPLGITQFDWSLDPSGNPHGMSGLQIRAEDLLKIGQMLLQGGQWNGRQLVSKAWIAQSTQAG